MPVQLSDRESLLKSATTSLNSKVCEINGKRKNGDLVFCGIDHSDKGHSAVRK